MQPEFGKKWTSENCKDWLHYIHSSQNIIDATIIANIDPQNPNLTINNIWWVLANLMATINCDYLGFRMNWQLLRVLQIFVEHTLEYVPYATIVHARRIKMVYIATCITR